MGSFLGQTLYKAALQRDGILVSKIARYNKSASIVISNQCDICTVVWKGEIPGHWGNVNLPPLVVLKYHPASSVGVVGGGWTPS